jgi:isopentenyl diphosphate isomerase/L-lactate dehydrogenase-like FMN-dependent dehydrogenase
MKVDLIRNVADARRVAKRTLPPVVFDYVDGGADDEVTMRANEAAFADVGFRPRMGLEVGQPDLGVSVLGYDLSFPVILAPCGLARLMHPDSAEGAARAAAGRGTVSVLSTVAGAPLERVVPEGQGRVWFQLYSAGGRADAETLCDRAAKAGVDVLMVTIDTAALGNRERDKRHGVTPPLRLGPRSTVNLGYQVLSRPGWTWRMARSGVSMLRSPPGARPGAGSGGSGGSGGKGDGGSKRMLTMAASPFLWSDIAWLAERWKGKLVVKGVLTGDDARRAGDSGAHGVVVSNHGGRQLDGVPATLTMLPEVVAAAGDQIEVLVDSGFRRGSHVVKALALGARAVMVGRPWLFGLAAAGQPGVEQVLDLFAEEMVRTMTLLGCPSVAELSPDFLNPV